MPEPVKLGFFGPMKTLESATWDVEKLPGGGLRAWIDHQPMRGVTPAAIRWWFENIDTRTTYNGSDFNGPKVPAYRYWHPFDHIRVRWVKKVPGADGRIGPGSIIHIEETIGGRYPVDAKARVSRFDDEAFNFDLLVGGIAPGRRGPAPLVALGRGFAVSYPGDPQRAHQAHRRAADTDRPARHVYRCHGAPLGSAQRRGKRRNREILTRPLRARKRRVKFSKRRNFHRGDCRGCGTARTSPGSGRTSYTTASAVLQAPSKTYCWRTPCWRV